MRKIIVLFASGYLLSAFLFVGCSKGSREVNDTFVLDSIQINESYFLFNDKDMPGCSIHIHFIYPTAWNGYEEEIKKLQALFIEKSLSDKYTGLAPADAVKAYKDHYLDTFKELEIDDNYKTYFDDNIVEHRDGTSYESYILLKNSIVYNDKGYISFVVEKNTYDGGAHNSSETQGYVAHLNEQRFLRHDEFEGNGYHDAVSKLLAEKIARRHDLRNPKELENIGYAGLEDIVPNDNFTLNNKGITYYFNNNDIAETMMGVTEVFIPYQEISIYMLADNPIHHLMK